MTSATDRHEILVLVEAAVGDGARRAAACAELGLHPRTLGRWRDPEGGLREDRRPIAERPIPANRLPPSASTSTGLVKPKRVMLSAIWRIWRREWLRALPA